MGHFAQDFLFQQRTAQGNMATSNNLEDDSEEEWIVESYLAVTEPVEEAKKEEAMLPALNEIEEKKPESMRSNLGKIMVIDELQSFEDEVEPELKPNPRYANAAITEDDNIQEPSTYEEASQGE